MRFVVEASFCLVCLCGVGLSLGGGFVQPALAQSADQKPIYLEEAQPEPPAKVVKRQKIREVYQDKELRAEREIALLSNDRIVNDGTFVEYYHDGQKYSEGKFEMGIFEGDWQYWYPNGQLCKKVTFKSGKPDGQWEVFNEEGVSQGIKSYRNGRRDGKWIAYHEDGKNPRMELDYQNGKPSGQRVIYYPNGQKRQVINFKDGIMEGLMTEWNEDGDKMAEAEFKAGKIVGQVRRFNSGSPASP